jgi:hypothetical protein
LGIIAVCVTDNNVRKYLDETGEQNRGQIGRLTNSFRFVTLSIRDRRGNDHNRTCENQGRDGGKHFGEIRDRDEDERAWLRWTAEGGQLAACSSASPSVLISETDLI